MFKSEAEQRLDLTTRECAFMGNQLSFALVALRQKVKPFIDEGVIYKDRKLVNKRMEKKALQSRNQINDADLEEEINKIRTKITDAINY